jgi:hypothetical protein
VPDKVSASIRVNLLLSQISDLRVVMVRKCVGNTLVPSSPQVNLREICGCKSCGNDIGGDLLWPNGVSPVQPHPKNYPPAASPLHDK